jgi:hypothetical protein
MALTKCRGDEKRVNSQAGFLSTRAGLLLLCILLIVAGNLINLPEPEENAVLKSLKKDPETQRGRKKLIGDFLDAGVFLKLTTAGGLPRVYVADIFHKLPWDNKIKFLQVVLGYYYSESKEMNMVLIYENRNGKKVGAYSPVIGGLKMD